MRIVVAATAALLLLAAVLAGRMAILWAETQRFEASSVCLAGGGDGCRALHGGVVVGTRETSGRGSTRYVSVRLPDRQDAVYEATVFVDYGLFDFLTVGLPIGVEEWDGGVTRLFRGERFLLTKDSPESRLDDAFYMLLLPLFFAGLVAPIGVEIRGRGKALPSTYELPRVIRPRRMLLFILGVLGLMAVAIVFDPFRVPFVPFRITSAHVIGIVTWGGAIALGWASMFRTTILLDVDHLTIRSWPGTRAFAFSELSSVEFVGSGDRQVLVLAVHGGKREQVALLPFAPRERAILAEVLGRSSGAGRASASVERVKAGDRGHPFGMRELFSMTGWQRVSPTAWWEWLLAPVGIALVCVFLGGAVFIDAPAAGRAVFLAVGGPLLALGVICWYTWRQRRLTERELRATGGVTRGTIDWIGEWSSPYWAFTYRYFDGAGTPRSGRVYGLAPDVLTRREGETGEVRYDDRGASLWNDVGGAKAS
ncbi:MAG: hypothetical protein E6J23_00895 [Chloroflexi bacterium]|nr:MAG: hypothetical protein E6J23_00895 [Chloroflexota bacterium]